MYGKIIDEKLVFAGNSITNKTGGTITNPTEKEYVENGWLLIFYNEKPSYDFYNQKLVEIYNEENNKIIVNYNIVNLTEEEKLNIKKQEVIELELKYNMCRWQRELILAENSGASDYTKDKAQEIENLAKELR